MKVLLWLLRMRSTSSSSSRSSAEQYSFTGLVARVDVRGCGCGWAAAAPPPEDWDDLPYFAYRNKTHTRIVCIKHNYRSTRTSIRANSVPGSRLGRLYTPTYTNSGIPCTHTDTYRHTLYTYRHCKKFFNGQSLLVQRLVCIVE